jgi:hypothetical protein
MKFKAIISVFLFSIFTVSFVGCFGCKKNTTAAICDEQCELSTKEVNLQDDSSEIKENLGNEGNVVLSEPSVNSK